MIKSVFVECLISLNKIRYCWKRRTIINNIKLNVSTLNVEEKSTKFLVDFLNLMSFLFLSTLFLKRRNLTAKQYLK